MFKKHFLNRTKLYFSLIMCAIAIFVSPTSAIISSASESSDIETCADYREWVYKIENGKLYKAILNKSTGLLETDWMYVCEWPPEE